MKILIITQKVDRNDDVLGFMNGWLTEFAKHFEQITVICLYKGEYNFPDNVNVLSLGKERGNSRLGYISLFYKYIWQERKNYDRVFVHMNQEYIILGWWLWKLLNKKTALWYNHTLGTWKARMAFHFANILFHTSPYAYSAGRSKSHRMPAGIDINHFNRDLAIQAPANSILYVGRLAPIKNVDILIDATAMLPVTVDLYGSAGASDGDYLKLLKAKAEAPDIKAEYVFAGSLANYKMPAIYNAHEISVNLTPRGNYDKTILETMACERIALVSSEAFKDDIPVECFFKERDSQDLKRALEHILGKTPEEKQVLGKKLRAYVIERHGLGILAEKIKLILS